MQIVVLVLPESPFGWASHHIATKRKVDGNFATVKNQTINTDTMHNMIGNKTTNWSVVSQASKVLDQKLVLLTIKFLKLIPDFSASTEKDEKGNFEISEYLFSPSNHCFGVNKIEKSDILNCLSSFACLSTAKVFTTTNTITKPGLFKPGRDSIKQSVYLEDGKFKIKQWRQKEPNLVIQIDAWKSGWRVTCNGVSTRGKWSKKEKNWHINVLELIAVRYMILTFTKAQSNTI